MGTITLPNFRVSADVKMNTRLKDGGVYIDWNSLTDIKVWLFSNDQKARAGRCDFSIDETDGTKLVCRYSASKPQYLGVNKIIVQATYQGATKTYDKPVFNFVRWTAGQAGEQITMDDPEVDVEIVAEDVSSSILDEATAAALAAADRAEAAAEAAEHMVDIHTGPAGKSPYIGENGHWFEWDEEAHEYVDTETNAKGDTGETPDITIGTVTTVEPGTPAGATMTGTPEAPVLNLSIPKGAVGSTPNLTVGTVTTGAPGTPVVVTITGTAEAPVLNITIPQGMQGNTGSSVEYPFELVNNLTTDDATKALSAAQGKVLDGKVTELEAKVDELGEYSVNQEFVEVHTDAEDKVLYGVMADGDFYFGARVPSQIQRELNALDDRKVDKDGGKQLSTEDYTSAEKTKLSALPTKAELDNTFDTKVDKEKGKSLINSNIASMMDYDVANDTIQTSKPVEVDGGAKVGNITSPEYIQVTTDTNSKVLEGIKEDGSKFIGGDAYVGGNATVNGTINGEYITNKVDKVPGKELSTNDFTDSHKTLVETEEILQNPEWIQVTTDKDGKIIEGIREDGTKFIANLEGISAESSESSEFENRHLVKIFDNNNLSVYRNNASRVLVAGFRDVVVWADINSLSISVDGFDGEQTIINLNSTNFPNLISGSKIERVLLTPWTRNATNYHNGQQWRLNVITDHAQIYHNFPSRASDSDGIALIGDEYRFDESVVWELPERWSPVRTTTGDDATLIATGKYKYFPGLNDSAYSFHPAINHDNGYGNGGFPAYVDKVNELNQTVRFSRFTQYRMDDNQDNSFAFMAGASAHTKLTLLGTYRDNYNKETRICVFMTNDGGRQWYCRYEFGAHGFIIDGNDQQIPGVASLRFQPGMNPLVITENFSSPSSGSFSIRARYQYTPTAEFKDIELTKKFKWLEPVEVQSITKDESNHVIVECADHNLHNGEVIIFTKNDNTSSDWDWMVNEGFGTLSCGNGVIFRAKVIDGSHLELYVNFANPHNNLAVRHIHSINRCKDGYTIGTGEQYPAGWIFYLPVWQSDAYARKYPWDEMEFVRLNSTPDSIQRPLGVVLSQDEDTTVTVGIDNENSPVEDAEVPAGRSESIRRSSNGLWRGKLVDFDDQTKFNCIFPSDEVCYFYKKLLGIDVYIGQQGHIGVSADDGNNWTETRTLNNESVLTIMPFGSTDVVNGGYIVIHNYIIKSKI